MLFLFEEDDIEERPWLVIQLLIISQSKILTKVVCVLNFIAQNVTKVLKEVLDDVLLEKDVIDKRNSEQKYSKYKPC